MDATKIPRKARSLPCKFLYGNAATINRPVSFVYTKGVSDQKEWWPTSTNTTMPAKPVFTLDTTYRTSYHGDTHFGPNLILLRSQSNYVPKEIEGIVPNAPTMARNKRMRLWKESTSMEHNYDSRKHDNYPMRGKRQGAYIWTLAEEPSLLSEVQQPSPLIEDRPIIANAGQHTHKRQHRRHPFKTYANSAAACLQPDFRVTPRQRQPPPFFTA